MSKGTRVVLHCGAHKTGTTTIQKCLSSLTPELLKKGIRYVEPSEINDCEFLNFLLYEAKSKAEEKKKLEQFVDFFTNQSAPSDISTVLVSHESILGFSRMLPPIDERSFYGDRRNALPRLAKLRDVFDDIQVIYYVRRQDRFLESVYLECLRQGYFTGDFADYLESGISRAISWTSLLYDLADVFGAASLTVRPFEEIKRGGVEFVKTFLAFITDHNDWGVVDERHDNPSLSAVGYLVATRCYDVLNLDQRRTMSRLLRQNFPPDSCGKAVLFEDGERMKLLKSFAKENATLCDRYFPEWAPYYLGDGDPPTL